MLFLLLLSQWGACVTVTMYRESGSNNIKHSKKGSMSGNTCSCQERPVEQESITRLEILLRVGLSGILTTNYVSTEGIDIVSCLYGNAN